MKLQNYFEHLAGLKNALPSERQHVAAAKALGSELSLRTLISSLPSNLPLREQALESRCNYAIWSRPQ